MRRILYLTTVDVTVHSFLIPHIQALKRCDYEVEVGCHLGSFADSIRGVGIPAHHLPFRRSMVALSNFCALFKLIRLMRRHRYDLVHVHTPVAAFLGRLAARLANRKIKTLYTAHGFHFVQGGYPLKNLLFLALEKLASLWTDALIVMNEEDYAAAQRYGLAPPESIFFVGGVGVDTNKFNPERLIPEEKIALKQALGCGLNKVVGMIAEFIPRKRHIDLLQAAERILPEYDDVVFILIGDGQLLPKLKNLTSTKPYCDKVKFLGRRQDVPKLLAIMDAIVLPSLREGLPRTIQEAMAAGIPVVVTNIKGNRDLVSHEETGLLVPPRNPETLSQAILRLLKDEGLARKMGKSAREIAVAELSLDKVVERIVAIHEGLLNKADKMGQISRRS